MLLSILREKYWVLGGRKFLCSMLLKCFICKRRLGKPYISDPPSLPFNSVSAFEITGLHLAGPLYFVDNQKVWVCLFTCAVFWTIRLELVISLSTSTFVQAQFVARRDWAYSIYSDNVTNFVGLDNAFNDLD